MRISRLTFISCLAFNPDTLVAIADAWEHVNQVPFRCGTELGDSDGIDLSTTVLGASDVSRERALASTWAVHLRCAAVASVGGAASEEEFTRAVYDANEFGYLTKAHLDETDELLADGDHGDDEWAAPAARAAVEAVASDSSRLEALPSRRVAHRPYRAIDRRFCGEKNKRTRWFSYDEEQELEAAVGFWGATTTRGGGRGRRSEEE